MATSAARRFPLPEFDEEPTGETIEAFFSAPQRLRGRQTGPDEGWRATDPLMALDDRLTWTNALRRESARHRRYGRPVAVAVIAAETVATAPPDGWLRRLAGPIAHSIRRAARETDLVTRAGEARFHVLLPETTEEEAQSFAERVVADCEVWLRSIGAPVAVRAVVAEAGTDATLEGAVEHALGEVPTASR